MRGAREIYEEQATHTRVRLTFYSFDGDGFSGQVDGFAPGFGRILACQTAKQFGGAAGSFSITVKKPLEVRDDEPSPGIGTAQSWTRLWDDPEGTWVLIQWVCDGVTIDGMLGIVDSLSENTTRQGQGERDETYTITGRDFGKIFEQTQTFVNVYDQAAAIGIAGIFQRLQADIAGPPGDFVEALINAWIGNYSNSTQPWRLPPGLGGQGFYNLLRRRIGCKNEEIDGFYADATLIAPDQDGKNLWALLQEYANGLMNELWLDLGPAEGDPEDSLSGLVPTVYLRRKPFRVHGDSQRWDQLLAHDLRLSDVAARQLAKGGPAHRFNYWIIEVAGRQGIELQAILQQQGNQPGRPGSIPIWNIASIEKHGLRKWQQGTPFLPISSRERGTQFSQLAANWLRRVHDWYVIAPMELSGTITTSRLRPEIRLGQRVREHRREGTIVYYVEGVTNTYAYQQGGRTMLTLTRGEYEDEDLLEHVYAELNRQPTTIIRETDSELLSQDFDEMVSQLANGEVAFQLGGVQELGEEAEIVDGGLPAEGAAEDDSDVTLDDADRPSPSEEDAARAFRGEPEQTIAQEAPAQDPAETDTAVLDQEGLESGAPINVPEEGLSGLPGAEGDPLFGLTDEELGGF